MKKLIILLMITSLNIFGETPVDFSYKNEPINPACVALFNSSIADFPYINAINMNYCQHSNATFQKIFRGNDGSYCFYVNDKDSTQGQYCYKVMGKTKNNIYVVNTHSSGGGTLVSSELLLLSLNEDKSYIYDKEKLNTETIKQLKLIGYIMGGDRCVGDFADVRVANNQVMIQQYQGNNPIDCEKTVSYTIHLDDKITKQPDPG